MTEQEVLKKLADYKDAILGIKNKKIEAEKNFDSLKTKTYHTIKHLVENNIEVKEVEILNLKQQLTEKQNLLDVKIVELENIKNNYNDILKKYQALSENNNSLQNELKNLQDQGSKTKQENDAAKEAFMQELSRVLNEASSVLDDSN